MKNVVIFHSRNNAVCLDGHTAAWVVWKFFGEKGQPVQAIPAIRGREVPRLPTPSRSNNNLYIVDYCFSWGQLRSWREQGWSITIIDHHKSNESLLNSLSIKSSIVGFFDTSESAATLAWKTLFPRVRMPYFLEVIRERDIFEKVHEPGQETDLIHLALMEEPRTFDFYDSIAHIYNRKQLVKHLVNSEHASKLAVMRAIIRSIAARSIPLKISMNGEISDVAVFLVLMNGSEHRYLSDVSEYIYDIHAPSCECVLSVSYRGNLFACGFRSPDGTENAMALAESLSGGGQSGAGSARTSQPPILSLGNSEKVDLSRKEQELSLLKMIDIKGIVDRAIPVVVEGKPSRLITLSPIEDVYAERICGQLRRESGGETAIAFTHYEEGLQCRVFRDDGSKKTCLFRNYPESLPLLELRTSPGYQAGKD